MDTEIELKLLVDPATQDLTPILTQLEVKVIAQQQSQLGNIYFDTPDNQLRALDMGLRVRSHNQQHTQTIKTAGRVVGGLHQRPEYNVPVDQVRPQLALFDADIWPQGVNLDALQERLIPQFSTHFARRTWTIEFADGSLVEMAFDAGEVKAGTLQQPISEVELELLKGQPQHLFVLANTLAGQIPCRLGSLSKAARGYRLAAGLEGFTLRELEAIAVQPTDSVERAFERSIKHALDHIQYHEEVMASAPTLPALRQWHLGHQLLAAVFELYQPVIPPDASEVLREEHAAILAPLAWLDEGRFVDSLLDSGGHYLRKLADKPLLETALRARVDVDTALADCQQLMVSERYAKFILALTEWLFEQGWRRYRVETQQAEVALQAMARNTLDQAWHSVVEQMRIPVLEQNYTDSARLLNRALLSGVCFRRLYEPSASMGFRSPWMDIQRGLFELRQLDYVKGLAEQLSLELGSFNRWWQRKHGSLLHALEHSIDAALQLHRYWH